MSNGIFHHIGVALSTIGSVLLLVAFAQQFFEAPIFNHAPILPSIALVVSGAALILVARTGAE